jgi:hypothetical protein
VAQQGSSPRRPGRLPTASRHGHSRATGRNSWDDAAEDEEAPPWAGPGVSARWADQGTRPRSRHAKPEPAPPVEAAGWDDAEPDQSRWDAVPEPDRGDRAPGSRSRMAAARSRRRSRMVWVWGGAAIAVAVIVAGLLFTLGGSPPPKTSIPGFVTTFQPGELKTVPSACTSVTAATLDQYLPGNRQMVAPHSLDGSAQSLCNWTVNTASLYRVLEVTVQAYAPSGLATGNGSATSAATDAYGQALQAKRHPARDTHLPAATVTSVPGLGTTAFAALQVVLARGASTDLETVVARDHNVLVTVVFQGPHAHTGKYRPAAVSALQTGATAVARDIVSSLH